ncbi:MAG: hypothetical protein ACRDJH_18325 [Thermomicrobiales bacterium]
MSATTIKTELHSLIELLDEVDAAEALDYLRWLASDEEELTPEELDLVREGEEAIARGEYITLTELRRSLGE